MINAKRTFHSADAGCERCCRSYADRHNIYQLIQIGKNRCVLTIKTVIKASVIINLMLLCIFQCIPLEKRAQELSHNAGYECPDSELYEILTKLVT